MQKAPGRQTVAESFAGGSAFLPVPILPSTDCMKDREKAGPQTHGPRRHTGGLLLGCSHVCMLSLSFPGMVTLLRCTSLQSDFQLNLGGHPGDEGL